jgi:hypothetical protein
MTAASFLGPERVKDPTLGKTTGDDRRRELVTGQMSTRRSYGVLETGGRSGAEANGEG